MTFFTEISQLIINGINASYVVCNLSSRQSTTYLDQPHPCRQISEFMSVGICDLGRGGVVTGSLVDTGYDVTLCGTYRLAVVAPALVAPGRSVRNIQRRYTERKSAEEISIRICYILCCVMS